LWTKRENIFFKKTQYGFLGFCIEKGSVFRALLEGIKEKKYVKGIQPRI